jgi:hypothetical protein
MNRKINAQTISGTLTLVTTVILVTPLCGLLFQCGCDWPWSGLDSDCNYYKSSEVHQCPWCASKITGLVSTGLAIGSGVLTAMVASNSIALFRFGTEVAISVLLGLLVFHTVASLAAIFAVLWQNYPLGIGDYFY